MRTQGGWEFIVLGNLLDLLIYRPFSWLLVNFYDITRSYVLAIILFNLVTKALLLYFSARGKLGTMRSQRLQPKVQALQKEFAKDKEKMNAELGKLYQREGVSPMSGCLWMLLPFPIFIMLYSIIREPLTRLMNFPGMIGDAPVTEWLTELFTRSGVSIEGINMSGGFAQMQLAQVVHDNFPLVQQNIEQTVRDIDFTFLGANMSQVPPLPWVEPSWVMLIPILSAVFAYLSYWVSTKMTRMPQTQQTRTMALFSPAISLWFGFTLPAAMSVYWIANSVTALIQDYFLTKHYNKVLDAEDAHKAELEARRKAAEQKQKEEERILRAERLAQKKKSGKGKYKVKKKP